VADSNGVLFLAPTFDHGASLARNITDKERDERLTTKDAARSVTAFARRARSAFYPEPGAAGAPTRPLSTYDAWLAFSRRCPVAKSAWLSRLNVINDNTVNELLGRIPEIRLTPRGREFTARLLSENRARLLEEAQHG
jgi:hypothetical protein